MKKTLKIGSALLSVVMMASCAGVAPQKGSKGAKVTITVGNWPSANDQKNVELYEGYLKEFNGKYPEIEVIPDTWGYDVNSFLPKAASGQLPTTYQTPFTETKKIIDAGYAGDVTEVMKENGYDKMFGEQYMELLEKDGHYYGVPISCYIMGLLCNVELFKQAGLTDAAGVPIFPKTYDELAQTAVKIKEKTGKAGMFIPTTTNQGGWIVSNIVWAFGGDFVEKDGDNWKAIFNSKECVDALTYVRDLKWKYNVLQDDILSDASNSFVKMYGTNQVGMGILTPTSVNNAIRLYGMDRNCGAAASLPAGPAKKAALLGGAVYMFGNTATEEQLDATFKWLETIGRLPILNDNTVKTWVDRAKTNSEQGLIVGFGTQEVFADKKFIDAKKEAEKPYVNVTPAMFENYQKMEGVEILPEPAVNAQEIYAAMDGILQEILTNENADIQKILDKAVSDFQKNYLDK